MKIVQLGQDKYEDVLKEPHAREFDITGRAMKGWILVEPESLRRFRTVCREFLL